jgi:acyl dehydratase
MAERQMSSAPGMLPLFARAGASMIPGASRLPFLGPKRGSDELPELTLVLEDVGIDRDRLAAYDRVCRFPLRNRLPATYIHILAFPLQLSLMTDSSFPFPALGLVHIANRIVHRRPVLISEQLDLKVWAADLKPHPRGRQFSLRTEATVGDELVWEEDSTILRRESSGKNGDGKGGDGKGGSRKQEGGESGEQLPVSATWRLPGDLGRRYASVSGDRNPIHIHPLSAKLFGFPTAIVHGMWTKARCLAALDPRLPDSFTVEVSFRKPILLPATVQFGERERASGIGFDVRGAGKGTSHLDGDVRFG